MAKKKRSKVTAKLLCNEDTGFKELSNTLNQMGRKEAGEALAILLSSSFLWEETPQGADYWYEVYRNLCELPEEKE